MDTITKWLSYSLDTATAKPIVLDILLCLWYSSTKNEEDYHERSPIH